jgi:membrane protein YqaA with SNARE-associated domain
MHEYDHWVNRRQYILFYGVCAALVSAVALSFFVDIDLGFVETVKQHVTSTIRSSSLLGLLYLSGIGGLFVFTFPMEALFVQSLASNGGGAALGVMLLGVTVSYAANYGIGWYLGGVIRPLIGTKSFFKWKARLNQYGSWIVVVVNIIPMVSQSFTAVLGVFHYDRRRMALYTFIGQFIKFGGIVLVTKLI